MPESTCAQRLSASTEGSHPPDNDLHRSSQCSTPFGINGRITPSTWVMIFAECSCSTPFGINGRITDLTLRLSRSISARAQRLSASTEGSPAPSTRFTVTVRRAQRLSASTEGSPQARCQPGHRSGVLNAFRHQRKDHVIPFTQRAPVRSVLNAFRHQRKDHYRETALTVGRYSSAQRLSASTEGSRRPTPPDRDDHRGAQRLSASTEGSQTALVNDRHLTQVLNSFRHQRKDHSFFSAMSAAVSGRCSTPFGINGRITSRRRSSIPERSSAQRLSASTEGSPGCSPRCRCSRSRAQRLSASTEGSPEGGGS